MKNTVRPGTVQGDLGQYGTGLTAQASQHEQINGGLAGFLFHVVVFTHGANWHQREKMKKENENSYLDKLLLSSH